MSCNTTQQVRFQLRRGDQTYWDNHALDVLLTGEPGYNTTTNQLKIGNGGNTWGQLPYINVAGQVGTYTTLTASTTILTGATLAAGSNSFGVTFPGGTQPNQGTRIQFVGGVVAPPLASNTAYYVLGTTASSLSVSRTNGGLNIVLLVNAKEMSSTQITLGNGNDDPNFTSAGAGAGQAIWFASVTGTANGGVNTATLYYVRTVSRTYTSDSSPAIIEVSLTPGGIAISK